jgi:hypothetical protein
MKKDVLISLYWILDAVQRGTEPNRKHVGDCFISIRDELLMPDTEDLVAHIYEALHQTQASADVLANQLIDGFRAKPLAERQLVQMFETLVTRPDAPPEKFADIAVRFGRLVEAAHGIKGDAE